MTLSPVTIACPVYAPPRPPRADHPPARPSAKYEAARTTADNAKLWAFADDLSANAAADPEVRRQVRRRCRYERDNGSHLNGLVKTLADDAIGTGPRLQLTLGERFEESSRRVAKSFLSWCRAARLPSKLRVMRMARPVDGEAFALLTTNPQLRHRVKLDLKLIEADQVETPGIGATLDPNAVSGIEFDPFGNPAFYHVLKQHPGDSGFWNWVGEYDRVAARHVLHWFVPTRPGQARGVSEFAPALGVGAQTRRYDAAVLDSAEFAASVAGVLTTEAPPPADGEAEPLGEWEEVPVSRAALLTLPANTKATQLKAEQPTSTYREFVGAKRAEMGRPVQAPANLVTGDSSDFNFASGRLDHLPYQRSAWIDRDDFRSVVLDRLFLAWVEEARAVGEIPPDLPDPGEWEWDWHWDAFGSLDPLKEASASEKRLALHLTTLAEECAADGKDWREVLKQRAAEKRYMDELGLTPPAPPPDPAPATVPEEVPDEN